MIIFDGRAEALRKERLLAERIAKQFGPKSPLKIASIMYAEDAGSVLYTNKKKDAAERVSITYETHQFSLTDPVEKIQAKVRTLNEDETVTGIIIQKPWRQTWQQVTQVEGDRAAVRTAFTLWWQLQTSALAPTKDVDGLSPETLTAIKEGNWQEKGKVLPATVRAVLAIMEQHRLVKSEPLVAILGKTDLLGLPLSWELKNRGLTVEIMGSKQLQARIDAGKALFDADVIVSATGRQHLVTADLISHGVALIDVGEPKPDIDRASVSEKAAFLTPVPGGVGPMTVVCLLENCFDLYQRSVA